MNQKNEVINVPAQRSEVQLSVVSKQDVEALKKQRDLLREFVSSQLVEATQANNFEGDYGVIPGTKKRTLFKQGAEKLNRLFQLGCRFKVVDKMIEREANFAMFTYKAEIYSLRNPDVVIAECDGSVNSQEVKYKERTEWREVKDSKGKGTGRKESHKVETPIFDVMNTLMKMAQKRAMLGATLLATGASEYFTQDMLEEEDLKKAPPAEGTEGQAQQQPEAGAAKGPSDKPPLHCGKLMMESKWPKSGQPEWYCLTCKTSILKSEAEGA